MTIPRLLHAVGEATGYPAEGVAAAEPLPIRAQQIPAGFVLDSRLEARNELVSKFRVVLEELTRHGHRARLGRPESNEDRITPAPKRQSASAQRLDNRRRLYNSTTPNEELCSAYQARS